MAQWTGSCALKLMHLLCKECHAHWLFSRFFRGTRPSSWNRQLRGHASFASLLPPPCGLFLCAQTLSCVQLFATHGLRSAGLLCPWDLPGRNTGVGCHFHWSGSPSPGDLPDPGIEPASLTSPALVGGFFTTSIIWEATFLSLALGKSH